MRNFNNWTVAVAAASLMAILGVAASSARAENNERIRPARHAYAPPKTTPALADLRHEVKKATDNMDGCR